MFHNVDHSPPILTSNMAKSSIFHLPTCVSYNHTGKWDLCYTLSFKTIINASNKHHSYSLNNHL